MRRLFVDTSAWSELLRKDRPQHPAVFERLRSALAAAEGVSSTGLVLQEVLQGFQGPRATSAIIDRFARVELLQPTRTDHLHAADIAIRCRRAGIQLKTVDALLTALCVGHDRVMLSADRDFVHAATVVPLQVWAA